ncbi:Protein of unknown function [Bacillus wiedmannii]|nr:Protein of unknown function [Bacillus wiedmannii]
MFQQLADLSLKETVIES